MNFGKGAKQKLSLEQSKQTVITYDGSVTFENWLNLSRL